jgi:hypothetical protein
MRQTRSQVERDHFGFRVTVGSSLSLFDSITSRVIELRDIRIALGVDCIVEIFDIRLK